ncbi:hypothetical protein CRV24_006271 [Beauveria bassiana]|uniref:Uncharacterized protein n=1 Tax=Beauveria bassiana (strain ARSEF 2860) TaxID=655819 RepID=J4KMD4_BEAB2|nr:uncharacterized protein BBA_07403 [Beauveria bassiana ARSEF 2860]EJP63759.1 hypothetical protein BBA_07403 [Beauveria bassiana ARSEF 2860]KAF1734726.1 hypothetical protein CRV24_006271 [Beauveria bassiana]KAH8708726.1 hypothetical protein HC256_008666 [Beauveria bassiana]
MSSVDQVAFMPRPAGPVERAREEPSTTHTTGAGSAAPASTLPPPGSGSISKPLYPASNTRAPEPPTASDSSKNAELQKPDASEAKPVANAADASLPSVSNLDAPPQPPKDSNEDAKPAATTASEPTATVVPAAPAAVSALLSAPSIPKPVEVKSVPDTPANTGTPAGGTPRPVLDISQEPISKPEAEAKSDAPTSVPEVAKPESASNGASAKPTSVPAAPAPTPAATTAIPGLSATNGQKRKFEDEADSAEKKAKFEEPSKPASNGNAEATGEDAASAGDSAPAPRKVGRPKKKATPAPVGRTQRKTRSQGAV